MKKVTIFSLVVLGALILGGCSLYGGTSTPSVATPSTKEIPAAPNAVNIQGFAFNPGILTVKKGTTVTWTNNDSASHQIKSATFNSGSFGKGQAFSFTFNDTGIFDYSCAIHPSMLGKIIVE